MSDDQRKRFNLKDRAKSFHYAFAGIKYLLRTQHNAWIHLSATALVALFGLYFRISIIEWCISLLAIGFVLTAEAINTALEALVDFVSPRHHDLAKVIKDVGAGAVLIASIFAALVGILIFGPKILEWMFGQM